MSVCVCVVFFGGAMLRGLRILPQPGIWTRAPAVKALGPNYWTAREFPPISHFKIPLRDFPGGPVVKTLCCPCKGRQFNPWSGNWESHMLRGQNKSPLWSDCHSSFRCFAWALMFSSVTGKNSSYVLPLLTILSILKPFSSSCPWGCPG